MSEKKSIGTVTLGCWNSEQREVEIENFMRCEFKDHRLISVVKTEEDAYLFCVENPASTGRSTEQKMYLTEGSAVALFSLCVSAFHCCLQLFVLEADELGGDRKSTRLNSSHPK